jgi:hypothetical protein
MSLATWKAQFYPESAVYFDKDLRPDTKTEMDAVQHSIRKWEGLLPHNMAAHGVHWGSQVREITDGDDSLPITGDTCALCVRHTATCDGCPLKAVRDNYSCDDQRPDEPEAPYFLRDREPEVMIMWLRKAEEYVEAQSKVQYTGGY